jgi:hypothetical protein
MFGKLTRVASGASAASAEDAMGEGRSEAEPEERNKPIFDLPDDIAPPPCRINPEVDAVLCILLELLLSQSAVAGRLRSCSANAKLTIDADCMTAAGVYVKDV